MPVLVNDAAIANQLLEQRRASGLDRYDEVWDGVYVMSPLANNEHQLLVTQLAAVLTSIIDWQGLGRTLAGANVSDRQTDWTQNYRVPDVLVFLNDSSAKDCGTHWHGGPDFAIEITSVGERVLGKLPFYASIGTREVFIIDRDPWQLALYRRHDAETMTLAAVSRWSQPAAISSEVLALVVALDPSGSCIRLSRPDGTPIREIPLPDGME